MEVLSHRASGGRWRDPGANPLRAAPPDAGAIRSLLFAHSLRRVARGSRGNGRDCWRVAPDRLVLLLPAGLFVLARSSWNGGGAGSVSGGRDSDRRVVP